MPIADGAHACPFVAFEDDRDERATVPDHRHRCYAEVRPAPRALAHQEAYCLSSAFPVCPTFQDWARRESARARDASAAAARAVHADADTGPESGRGDGVGLPAAGASAADGAAASASTAPPAFEARDADDDEHSHGDPSRFEEEPRRNPPREWSAPPPWLASAEAAARTGSS